MWRERQRCLRAVVVVGTEAGETGTWMFSELMMRGSASRETEPTSKVLRLFGCTPPATGPPKGCVHLQHDMVVCAQLYAQDILGIAASDRCFSAARLFFAYGLGNALYFPFSVGGTAPFSNAASLGERTTTD